MQNYCKKCGEKMHKTETGAEEAPAFMNNSLAMCRWSKYHGITGKRQYVYKYTCPNATNLFNKHDVKWADTYHTKD